MKAPSRKLASVFALFAVAVSGLSVSLAHAAQVPGQQDSQIDARKDASSKAGETAEIDVVRQLTQCFNRHDPQAMVALMHEDCEITYVSQDGKSQLSASNAADIEKEMAQFFRQLPTVKSEIRQTMQAGGFVTVEEHVEWTAGETKRSQASLGVFEVADGKIRRVWYYPAYR